MRGSITTTLGACALACAAMPTLGAIVGFTEDFNAGFGGWGGGATLDLIASGGVGGAGDGYLLISNSNPAQLATRNTTPAYTGDLIADGVTGMTFWLRDLGGEDTLRLHVAVGNPGNFWTSVVEFSPGAGAWEFYEVDFTNSASWVRQQGSGTFEEALRSTNRMQFRNDPLVGDPASPDGIADFALDRITLVPSPGTLVALLAFGPLVRRRSRSS